MAHKKIMAAIQAEINKTLKELGNRENMKTILDEATTIVRRRTLLGFGVPSNGASRVKLKPLSQSYKDQRAGKVVFYTDKLGRVRRVKTGPGFKSRIKLSDRTTPSKSNLTLSFQMLASLRGRYVRPGFGVVEPTGTRSDGMTNAQIAEFVTEQGRAFLNLSNNEIRQLEIFIENIGLKILKKKLTKII